MFTGCLRRELRFTQFWATWAIVGSISWVLEGSAKEVDTRYEIGEEEGTCKGIKEIK